MILLNEEFFELFLGFLFDMDRGLIKDVFDNFDSVDENEFFDVFLNFNFRVYFFKDNFRKFVVELVYYEFI